MAGEHAFDMEEAARIAKQIDVEEVTDENGNFVREKTAEKVKEITKDRNTDPTHYEGTWMNNLMKVEKELGRY